MLVRRSLVALLWSLSLVACADRDDPASAPEATAAGSALAPCTPDDFAIPAPARPSSGAEEGTLSLQAKGAGTVRFHGRASDAASWVASVPKDVAYTYLEDEEGGRVSFDVRLDEAGGKGRTTTVRLAHHWRADAQGKLCSAPVAALSIHENIDDEPASALAGSVLVSAFDPDARHVRLAFEAETTAYKIFVDLDVTGIPRVR